MSNILIIDDDKRFADASVKYFQGRGFQAEGFNSVSEAMRRLSKNHDLAIIDLNLLDGSGFDVLDKIKHSFPHMKTIIITGFDGLPKRLRSFAQGADDYMKKPIFPAELVARIKRLLKKEEIAVDNRLYEHLSFTRLEMQVMELLEVASGGVVPVNQLLDVAYTKNAMYTTLSRLKRKLPSSVEIKSAYGRGYYLKKRS